MMVRHRMMGHCKSLMSSRRGQSRTILHVLAAAAAALCVFGHVLSCSPTNRAWVSLPPFAFEEPAARTTPASSQLTEVSSAGRRAALGGGLVGVFGGFPDIAMASGGSTAGKYSTIPSAKRKFYGRMRQGIFEFLQMEKPIMDGELKNERVTNFFAKTIIKFKAGVKQQGCAIDLGGCESKEQRTSRWNDMKAASDLLASAFRYSAEDRNDLLPQVRIIRKFHKKVEKMETAIEAGDAQTAQDLYAKAKNDLSKYVPMVELSALDSEDYTHEWDTAPQVICQGTFCV